MGTDIAGRDLRVFPDDAFIASYPRSGNTWTGFLIANLMHPERPVTFANIESVIPDATALSSRALKRVPRPRLIKTDRTSNRAIAKSSTWCAIRELWCCHCIVSAASAAPSMTPIRLSSTWPNGFSREIWTFPGVII